jgi:glutathione peroxidase
VKGKNQSPVYKWLSTPEQNGWCDEVPSWNFCKYVIDEEGKLTHFFGLKVKPDSEDFISAIQ